MRVHKRIKKRGEWYDAVACRRRMFGYMPRSLDWAKVTCKHCLRHKK